MRTRPLAQHSVARRLLRRTPSISLCPNQRAKRMQESGDSSGQLRHPCNSIRAHWDLPEWPDKHKRFAFKQETNLAHLLRAARRSVAAPPEPYSGRTSSGGRRLRSPGRPDACKLVGHPNPRVRQDTSSTDLADPSRDHRHIRPRCCLTLLSKQRQSVLSRHPATLCRGK